MVADERWRELTWTDETVFGVEALAEQSCALLVLWGELDDATCGILDRALQQQVGAGSRHVVLDLTDLDFIGAAGLHVLVETDRRLRCRSARLTLRGPGAFVRRLLALTGLSPLVEAPGTPDWCPGCQADRAVADADSATQFPVVTDTWDRRRSLRSRPE